MLEALAVAFNVAYVILAARRSIWCWPMGIIGSALSIALWIEVKLYAEAVLFSYYIWMGAYGWLQWKRKSPEQQRNITSWPLRRHLWWLVLGNAGALGIYAILRAYTDAEELMLDAYTTSFSFIATYLVARRQLENWIYWIAIDSLSVYLYLARGLELYPLLMVMYTFMAVYGYWSWRKARQPEHLQV